MCGNDHRIDGWHRRRGVEFIGRRRDKCGGFDRLTINGSGNSSLGRHRYGILYGGGMCCNKSNNGECNTNADFGTGIGVCRRADYRDRRNGRGRVEQRSRDFNYSGFGGLTIDRNSNGGEQRNGRDNL